MKFVSAFAAFILLTINSGLFAQSDSQQVLMINEKVKDIQTHLNSFNRIEKIKTGNGYNFVYLKDNCLQKVEVYSIEETIHKKVEWFFNDNTMICVKKNWTEFESGKIIEQEKIYTNEKQIISWLDKNNCLMDHHAPNYQLLNDEVIAYGKNLLLKNQH